MEKRIRPTKIGNFGYGQNFDYGSFTLTEGSDAYHVQMLTPHFQQFATAISELASFLTDKTDAVQGSGVVAPRQVSKVEALPGVDQYNVVLEITTANGRTAHFALPVETSASLRAQMEDAEKFTSGALGQTRQ